MPVRDDRRWARLPARALAPRAGTTTRSASVRRHAAERRGRLEFWSKARARTLMSPVSRRRRAVPQQLFNCGAECSLDAYDDDDRLQLTAIAPRCPGDSTPCYAMPRCQAWIDC